MPGLLQILTAQQSQAKADTAVAERVDRSMGEQPADVNAQLLCRVDSYIESCWQAAKSAKESEVEPEMLEDLRQREGIYSPSKLAEIRSQGGSEIYMMLTNVKCRAAEGWIRDILLPSGERPFTCRPTPVPDLSPDIKQTIFANTMAELQQILAQGIYPTPQQVYERSRAMYEESMQRLREEAKVRAQREEDAIDDVLVEGEWYEGLDAMISDLVSLPAAFLKGPAVRKKRRLKWQTDPATGKSVPVAADELTPMFYSPSGLDIYPSPDSRDTEDGYLFERIPVRRNALYGMIGVPGYDEKRIRAALEEYGRKGFDLMASGDQQRRDLENSSQWQMTPDHSIDTLEFHGSVRGEWLLEWGMDKAKVPDPDAEYEVTALKVGRHIVRCVLNEDPLRRRPYMKCSYDSIKGQFWGRGLPRLLRDLQSMCNAAARGLSNNMGLASGPMVEVEVDRLAEGETMTNIFPWKIFQSKQSSNTNGPAVRFYQPENIIDPLLKVFSYFSQLADSYSGIPSYEQGLNPTTGAAGTAAGLSMLMSAASRQIKRVIAGVDTVIEGSVQRVHGWIMLFRPDPNVTGDIDIVARGAASLIAKEQQQLRRTQFLASTANPFDAPIMGQAGRAKLLRETVQSMDLDPDGIVPSEDEMLARERMQSMAPPQGAPGAPGQGGMPGQPPQTLDPSGRPAGGGDVRM